MIGRARTPAALLASGGGEQEDRERRAGVIFWKDGSWHLNVMEHSLRETEISWPFPTWEPPTGQWADDVEVT